MFGCCVTPSVDGPDTASVIAPTDATNVQGSAEHVPALGAAPRTHGAAVVKSAEPAGEFEVTFSGKALGQTWGLKLETIWKVAIFVASVSPESLAERYNQEAPEALRIRSGDYIVAANGAVDTGEMLRAMQEQASLRLAIRHPRIFTAKVPKRGRPLGLTAKHNSDDGFALFVAGIAEEGAVKTEAADIDVGDIIIAVNGHIGNAKTMLEEIKHSEEPELTIARRC
mmetsp:Transcript_99920/g.287149  ORF Transcript_99920/g.287149 Transcript_99920/m.287149 type:complete len:226 (-) Transcript_99920:274-951(-)